MECHVYKFLRASICAVRNMFFFKLLFWSKAFQVEERGKKCKKVPMKRKKEERKMEKRETYQRMLFVALTRIPFRACNSNRDESARYQVFYWSQKWATGKADLILKFWLKANEINRKIQKTHCSPVPCTQLLTIYTILLFIICALCIRHEVQRIRISFERETNSFPRLCLVKRYQIAGTWKIHERNFDAILIQKTRFFYSCFLVSQRCLCQCHLFQRRINDIPERTFLCHLSSTKKENQRCGTKNMNKRG